MYVYGIEQTKKSRASSSGMLEGTLGWELAPGWRFDYDIYYLPDLG